MWMCQHRKNVQTRFLLQTFQGRTVLWIEHGHGQHISFAAKWVAMKFPCQLRIDQLLYVLGEPSRQEREVRNAKLTCQDRKFFVLTSVLLFERIALYRGLHECMRLGCGALPGRRVRPYNLARKSF